MKRSRRTPIIALGVCAAFFAAAAGLIASGQRATTAVASASETIVWLVPNGDATQDGNLKACISTPHGTNTIDLGQWQRAQAVSYADGITLSAWSTTQGASVAHLAPVSVSSRSVPAGPLVLRSAFYDQESKNIYYQEAESVVDIAVGVSAQTLSATHPLPTFAPDAIAGVPPIGFKGPTPDASVGTVEAFVSVQRHPLALVATGAAAGIVDLTDMKATPIAGFSSLYGAATGSDGNLYVAAWRSFEPSFTIRVLRIDPSNLQVVAETDTGLTPGTTDNITIMPWSNGAVVMIAQGNADSLRQYVWTVDANGMKPASELPAGTGLYMAPGDQDSVLLFGGPAVNRVSRFDIASGALTDVPELHAPAGSYVVAVQQ